MADRRARTIDLSLGLTAASENLADTPLSPQVIINQILSLQDEAWQFYHALGELEFAIGVWLGGAMSRVRLVPATVLPGEEPTPITDKTDPMFKLVAQIGNGIGGQAALMKRLAVLLSVPGEGYLIGTQTEGNGELWKIYSNREIRSTSKNNKGNSLYEVNISRGVWTKLDPNATVVSRIWQPDDQFAYLPQSSVMSALGICREIDMYNRYIIAVLVSRLALNGMLLIPAEVSFPTKPQFKDQSDPFVAELIDIMTKSIKNPGSASAALPIPLRVPKEYIEAFKHLTFDTKMGETVIADRKAALERLAVTINIPAEVMTGMAKMNHWGQWQLEESAVKIYISPLAEIIVTALTEQYAYPLLTADGESLTMPDGSMRCIWYDASTLVQQPDTSTKALAVFDVGGLSEEALNRESGFEPDDMPDMDQFKTIALKKIAMAGGADALQALAALTGDESLVPPTPAPPTPADQGTPTEPPPPGEGTAPPLPPKPVEKAPPPTRPTAPPPVR